MDNQQYDDQIPEEIAPKVRDTSFVKRAGKRVWEAIRSLPGEFLSFWKSYPLKARKIAAIVAAVVLVAGVVGTLVFPDYTDCAFYIKDGEMYLCSSNGATRRITNDLILNSEERPYADWYLSELMDNFTYLSKDGKRLFYMDHATLVEGLDGKAVGKYDLYWVDITKYPSFPVKIAKDVVGAFYVNSKGDLVTYRKEKEIQQLYQYNMLVSKQIATIWNTDPFSVLEDGDTIVYIDRDQPTFTKYRKDGHRKPEKIDEKAESVTDDNLEDDTKFYITQEVESYKGIDFVVDDWNGVSFNGYSHQQILDKIKVTDVSNLIYTLWYFDGKESQKISDTALATKWCAKKADVLFYMDYGTTELPKLSLKDLVADCQEQGRRGTTPDKWVPTTAYTAWREKGCLSICVGAERKATTLKNVKRVHVNDAGTTAYIWAGSEDLYLGPTNLYRVRISDDGIGEPELLMQVETDYNDGEFYSDDMYVYVSSGALYVNGEKVDSNVIQQGDLHGVDYEKTGIKYCEKTGNLYYLKDTDAGRVLAKYDGKASEVIQEGVREFILTQKGNIVARGEGVLWFWNGLFSEKVEQNVGNLIVTAH